MPTPAERAATLELARALLAAVTNDERWPAPFDAVSRVSDGQLAAVFRLAQDLVAASDGIADLLRCIDDAKRATGDERVTGEPLDSFITRIVTELRDLRARVADQCDHGVWLDERCVDCEGR